MGADLLRLVLIGLDEQSSTLSQKVHHLVLPVVALGMLGIGNIALHTRSKVAEVMNSEFIHYAKAQGDKGWSMISFHVVKHAITPAICLQFASIGELLSGALLAEKVFAYPGLCFKQPLMLAYVVTSLC